ncbi:TonB family protein [Marinoscillum sp.]|uniref:energy transducer TonB n=1 Tax=Marinoscillum sp. TaxID=2024838 RepID=UPI003BA9A53F
MSANKDNISREEMRQYLEGKLSGKQAHRVERYLLENDFAEEAMEGFEGFDQEEIDQDLDLLRSKVSGQKRREFFYYIAASIALLLVAISSVWYFSESVNQDTLSYKQEESANKGKINSKSSTESPTGSPTQDLKKMDQLKQENLVEETQAVVNPEQAKRGAEATKSKSTHRPIAESTTSKDDVFEEEVLIEDDLVLAEVTMEEEQLPESIRKEAYLEEVEVTDIELDTPEMQNALTGRVAGVQIPENRTAAWDLVTGSVTEVQPSKKIMIRGTASISRSNEYTGPYVTGQITDADGNPLPGVNVLIKGTTTGTISDVEGHYTIPRIEDGILNYSFIGMESVDIQVGDRDTIDVELESDVQALSEVVVVGYGSQDDEIGFVGAEPVGGMKAYKDYLKAEMNYPSEAISKEVEGKVILKVTILASGEIGPIEVRRSLGFGCDEEATRLVKEGPEWQPAQRDGEPIDTEVRIKVVFDRNN